MSSFNLTIRPAPIAILLLQKRSFRQESSSQQRPSSLSSSSSLYFSDGRHKETKKKDYNKKTVTFVDDDGDFHDVITVLGIHQYTDEEYESTFVLPIELELTWDKIQFMKSNINQTSSKKTAYMTRGLEKYLYPELTMDIRRQGWNAILDNNNNNNNDNGLELYSLISREALCEAQWIAENDANYASQWYQQDGMIIDGSNKYSNGGNYETSFNESIWPVRERTSRMVNSRRCEVENDEEEEEEEPTSNSRQSQTKQSKKRQQHLQRGTSSSKLHKKKGESQRRSRRSSSAEPAESEQRQRRKSRPDKESSFNGKANYRSTNAATGHDHNNMASGADGDFQSPQRPRKTLSSTPRTSPNNIGSSESSTNSGCVRGERTYHKMAMASETRLIHPEEYIKPRTVQSHLARSSAPAAPLSPRPRRSSANGGNGRKDSSGRRIQSPPSKSRRSPRPALIREEVVDDHEREDDGNAIPTSIRISTQEDGCLPPPPPPMTVEHKGRSDLVKVVPRMTPRRTTETPSSPQKKKLSLLRSITKHIIVSSTLPVTKKRFSTNTEEDTTNATSSPGSNSLE